MDNIEIDNKIQKVLNERISIFSLIKKDISIEDKIKNHIYFIDKQMIARLDRLSYNFNHFVWEFDKFRLLDPFQTLLVLLNSCSFYRLEKQFNKNNRTIVGKNYNVDDFRFFLRGIDNFIFVEDENLSDNTIYILNQKYIYKKINKETRYNIDKNDFETDFDLISTDNTKHWKTTLK